MFNEPQHIPLINHQKVLTMTKEYDLIVIGTGIASVPARKAAQEGWTVALVDELPPGGTCALRGCTPKKYLRSGAEVMDLLERMNSKGLLKNDASSSWADLQKHRYEYTNPIPSNNEKQYENAGIDFYCGFAKFENPNEMSVKDSEGTLIQLKFRNCVIATGARPTDLHFPGHEHLLSSDDFLELPALPNSILFTGGGFISMEYAHIASRFGTSTKVIQRGALPLKGFDPDLVKQLVNVGQQHSGVEVLTQREIVSVEKLSSGEFSCQVKNQENDTVETYQADAIFHGAGRIPNIDRLNLDAAGIAHSRKGITVNDFLQSTSASHIYAAGDCADTGSPQLSFSASREGVTLSQNLLEGNQHKVNYAGQASVAFTLPAIAQAGITEQQANELGLDVTVVYHETQRWFTNRRLNEGAGASKIIIEKGTEKILGAHFLAHHCEEFINVFALAIHHGLTKSDLKTVPWAHPTSASDLARLLG